MEKAAGPNHDWESLEEIEKARRQSLADRGWETGFCRSESHRRSASPLTTTT